MKTNLKILLMFAVGCLITVILMSRAEGNGTLNTEKNNDGITIKDFKPDYLIHKLTNKSFFVTVYSVDVKRSKSITNLVIESFTAFKKKYPNLTINNIVPVTENWGYGAMVIGFLVTVK